MAQLPRAEMLRLALELKPDGADRELEEGHTAREAAQIRTLHAVRMAACRLSGSGPYEPELYIKMDAEGRHPSDDVLDDFLTMPLVEVYLDDRCSEGYIPHFNENDMDNN